jgi:hypothetical protein
MPAKKKSVKKTEEKRTRKSAVLDFSDAFSLMEKSPEFARWKKKNPKDYFASAFTVIEGKEPEWQFCFYDSKKDRVTTFTIKEHSTSVLPESEVFKEPGSKMGELDESLVKISLSRLISITNDIQQEKYPIEKPVKIIVVLTCGEAGPLWTATYLTQTFKTLVMKVSAETGEVISDSIISFFSTIKKDSPENIE